MKIELGKRWFLWILTKIWLNIIFGDFNENAPRVYELLEEITKVIEAQLKEVKWNFLQ
jgi:hypothetical protein